VGVSIDTKCGRDVRMTKQRLNCFRVRTLTNEEARQRVTEIVEAESYCFALLEHTAVIAAGLRWSSTSMLATRGFLPRSLKLGNTQSVSAEYGEAVCHALM
jgi:hypothetical protein